VKAVPALRQSSASASPSCPIAAIPPAASTNGSRVPLQNSPQRL